MYYTHPGCRTSIFGENRAYCIRDFTVCYCVGRLHQHVADRGVQIPKYCVHISPRILTTDPRPQRRPQADAVSDPLSVRESATRFLSTSPQAPAAAMCPIHLSVAGTLKYN